MKGALTRDERQNTIALLMLMRDHVFINKTFARSSSLSFYIYIAERRERRILNTLIFIIRLYFCMLSIQARGQLCFFFSRERSRLTLSRQDHP